MDVRFIPATYRGEVRLPETPDLPEHIALFGSIQFLDHLEPIKQQLEAEGKTVILPESRNYYYQGKQTVKGQLLGCNLEDLPDVDAFLYIGDGMFHPKILAVKNPQPIYVYNPLSGILEKIDVQDIERMKKKREGARKAFLASKRIGVIVSTKPGQNYLTPSLDLKKRYPDKEFYHVVFNTLDFQELENFPFVEVWINTACYRIGYDDLLKIPKPLLNLQDLA